MSQKMEEFSSLKRIRPKKNNTIWYISSGTIIVLFITCCLIFAKSLDKEFSLASSSKLKPTQSKMVKWTTTEVQPYLNKRTKPRRMAKLRGQKSTKNKQMKSIITSMDNELARPDSPMEERHRTPARNNERNNRSQQPPQNPPPTGTPPTSSNDHPTLWDIIFGRP